MKNLGNLGNVLGESLGDDYGDYDDANAFGLDEFGQVTGMNPMWGVVASVGVGTLTTVAIQELTSWDKWAELIGLGAAAVPAGALIAMKKTRAAGWTGLFAAVLNHGPRALQTMLSDKAKAKAAFGAAISSAKAKSDTAATPPAPSATPPTQGWGGVEIMPTHTIGMTEITPTYALGAPHEELPQLVGSAFGQAQRDMSLLGGPQLSDLSARFGSTHFNKA